MLSQNDSMCSNTERKIEYCTEIAHLLNKDHECLLFSSAALGARSTQVNKEGLHKSIQIPGVGITLAEQTHVM